MGYLSRQQMTIEALGADEGLKLREMQLKDGKLDMSLQGEKARIYMEYFIQLFQQNDDEN